MTGVSLCQWRTSVGMFNLKSVHNKCAKANNQPYYNEPSHNMLSFLAGAEPLKILLGVLTVFAYSCMIISNLSIFLILYPYFKFFCEANPAFYPYLMKPAPLLIVLLVCSQ